MAAPSEGEGEAAEAGPGLLPRGRLGRPPGSAMPAVPLRPFCAFLGGLGLLCLAFVAAWCQRWRGGFAWDGSARMFNWHPVLMVAGMTPNMYSLHSWLGLATVLLFSCQWLAGFSAFLLPYAPPWLRALYKPVHVFFGSTILMLSVASCVSGINEKLFFSLKNGTAPAPYNRLPPEAVFANTLGLLIVLFGVLVLCALAKPDWKRPEDGSTDTRQPLLGTER
ncbi:Cytochrome b ascorbate-dependent protein 3 isoform X2 [Aix galericulata]|nr:Cytochrome b ascorbate-dependent protein 3 isoform X2 [Aix galericulata]